jgi:hypothetical protein
MNEKTDLLIGLMREGRIGLRSGGIALVVAGILVGSARAAGPDVCAALPLSTVVEITHQKLDGVRSDNSEDAHSYGCSYGGTAHVSVSVIRPGGAQAFARTQGRLSHATAITGVGDKGMFMPDVGLIVLYGDTAIDAFVPPGSMSDAEILQIERSLVSAVHDKLSR